MRRLIAGTAVALAIAGPAHADLASRMGNALKEAQTAQQATDLDEIRLHLLYAMICVGGREAMPYPPENTGPCSDRASAASEASDPLQKTRLERATNLLGAGRVQSSMRDAQDHAEDAIKLIQLVKAATPQSVAGAPSPTASAPGASSPPVAPSAAATAAGPVAPPPVAPPAVAPPPVTPVTAIGPGNA